MSSSGGQKIKTIPVFHPTLEEFTSGFTQYIERIQGVCMDYGLAKIVPPSEWNPKASNWFGPASNRLVIPAPITQYVNGGKGIFQQTNVVQKPMKVSEFKKLAEKAKEARGNAVSDEEIERRFWKNIRFEPPMYGADMKGSLFPPSLFHWNVSRLTEQNLLKYLGVEVDGVNSAYLYFGMWKAMFSWHTEDMDLFSINFLHHGEPKRWYTIPESDRHRFEQLASSHFGDLAHQCRHFLRHKTTMISPSVIRGAGIPLYTGVQREGEFIITFPGSYHAGFNHGFNCAESLNFAVDSWISRGSKATVCQCKPDNVRIDMDIFLSNYRSLQPSAGQSAEDSDSVDCPRFTLDYLETINDIEATPEEEEEPISITIALPGARKTITKKKKKKKSTARPTRRKSSPKSVRATANHVSFLSLDSLHSLPPDQVPSSPVPTSLIEANRSALTRT